MSDDGVDAHKRTIPYRDLDAAAQQPVLKRELFPDPVILERVELLRYKDSFLCRVRTPDGAEGLAVSNNMRMAYLYPIHLQRVQPFFVGRDARDLDSLVDGVYVYRSNYKMQSYALWVPIATVELAILDLLGRLAQKPLGALIGDIHHPDVPVYLAPHLRDQSAEASVAQMAEAVATSGLRAVKFKIGGRMGADAEPVPGRTDQLIPLARQVLGDAIWLAVDANGGYRLPEALRMGRMLEAHGYSFFEEPLPFDWYEETQACAAALEIPIAGGEEEASLHTFRRLIRQRVLDVVRPDVFYFGGMIRAMRVARMAAAAGLPCIPHMSGSGLGYLYQLHFVSTLPNAGPYHPQSRAAEPIPVTCATSSLAVEDGKVHVPTGPGMGVEIDPDFVAKHRVVQA
jgi:L-alanine-DL-glutamate epimerase-like enolase superfamily enzyme